jgi:hypothetical protein
MRSNRRGFSLYLTFLVTTVIFILVTGSYEISRIALDTGKSSAIDALLFHAADGGLERGLAKVREFFSPIQFSYKSSISQNRSVEVNVNAVVNEDKIDITSTAVMYEGKKQVATRSLIRKGVEQKPGRSGTGEFMEAS